MRLTPGVARGTETECDWPVLVFAGFVLVLLVLAAFFTDHTGYVDELGLYNPAYMLARYGNLTYPAYGLFDTVIVIHPPVHVGAIGLFQRLGFTWYYGEAMPTFLWFLVGIVAAVRGPFASTVKLGLLFSTAFLLHVSAPLGGIGVNIFGTRPEGHVQAAWMAGLILPESGRLDGWRKSKLFAGGFALTWASAVHYYAVAACLGVAVYMIAAVRQLGWRKAGPALAALAAGACLFGLPYLFAFLLPYRKPIAESVRTTQGSGGVSGSLAIHWRMYQRWSHAGVVAPAVRWAMRPGVPLAVFTTAILGADRRTRVLAFAALPMQAFILLFASHKHGAYLVHEVAIFGLALAMGAMAVAGKLAARIPKAGARRALLTVSAGVLCLYLSIGNQTLRAAKVTLKPRLHEGDVARAASRELIGMGATVASPISLWYASGAAYWYYLPDVWPVRRPAEAAHLFECFDAAAASEFRSADAQGGQWQTMSFQYAEGTLKLRGFYFGDTDEELQFVLLHPHPAGPLTGYAAEGERLFRFDERADGDYEVISAVCPNLPHLAPDFWRERFPSAPSAMLYLPQPRSDGAFAVATVLAARAAAEPAGMLGRSCRVLTRVRGGLREVDRYALVDGMRRTDAAMEFYRSAADIPGCQTKLDRPAGPN